MARPKLSENEKQQGRSLGRRMADRRSELKRSAELIANAAGISVETLRKIEHGAVANPGVFTVAAVADELELSLDALTQAARGDRS